MDLFTSGFLLQGRQSPVALAVRHVFLSSMVVALAMFAFSCSSDSGDPNGPDKTSDNIAPTVSAISPADGATSVSPSTTVTVTFSEPIDATTLTSSSFKVSSVSGAVVCNGASACHTPSASLAYGQTYTVTITTAVTDTAGNALASEFTSSFTVVGASELPVADAGNDAYGSAGYSVTLDGSGSHAPGSGTLTYAWRQIAGPDVTWLSGLNRVNPQFTTDTVYSVFFELVVSADGADSPPDTVGISILQDADYAVWVDRTAQGMVYATIQDGIDVAVAAGFGTDVYVVGGVYSESITLETGVSVYGGYMSGGFGVYHRKAGNMQTVILGGPTAVRGDHASDLVLDGLRIESADATAPGQSSIAVSLNACNNVLLSRSTMAAGTTVDGVDQVQPGPAPKGAAGANGEAGDDDNDSPGGNGGASSVGSAGGKGGLGNGAFMGHASYPGKDGLWHDSATGGSGGSGGSVGNTGGSGGNGTSYAGVVASHGAGGFAFGQIDNNGYYVASDGKPGEQGEHGKGGGGGGSGGFVICGTESQSGGGGGGGGAGGVGGYGGPGGGGAGGSFALAIYACNSVKMFACSLSVVMPGDGGDGVPGGVGGVGGAGGGGGDGFKNSIVCEDTGRGGNGGKGGDGGTGGTGGGGAGGPAICIIYDIATDFTEVDPNTDFFTFPTNGGDGGTGSGGLGGLNEGAKGAAAIMMIYDPANPLGGVTTTRRADR